LARVLLVLGVLIVASLAGLWIQRKPIAENYINAELTRRGVPARYKIADLGFARQRLTDVSIGDPARPDLVADWVEVRIGYGLSGPSLSGVRAGKVRMRGALVDGRFTLGAIDKLLPAGSGGPFTLPKLHVDVADARMRLETPHGLVGFKASGSGRLDDGFTGRLAAVAPRLAIGGCVAGKVQAALSLRIVARKPDIAGPVRIADMVCGDTRVAGLGADVTVALGEALDQWTGKARLGVRAVGLPGVVVGGVFGDVTFDGGPERTNGTVKVASGAFGAGQVSGAALGLDGRYALEGSGVGFDGRVSATRAAVAPALLGSVARLGMSAPGTPVAPLLDRFAKAAIAAGRALDFDGTVVGAVRGGVVRVAVSDMALVAATGARVTLDRGAGVLYEAGKVRLDGTLALGGGGLPEAALQLVQPVAGAAVTGAGFLHPYEAGGARLALETIRFRATPGGETRFTTRALLSGPLGDGRVDALSLPIDGRWNGARRLVVNSGCVRAGFARLAVAGLALNPAALRLCPVGAAMLAIDGARMSGGVRADGVRLSGALGSTPLTLAANQVAFRLGDNGFSLGGVAVRLGASDSVTRIDAASLDGRIAGGGIAGGFAGAGGQIGKVSLLLSDASGGWNFAGGKLTLSGKTRVTDAAETARFEALASDDIALSLEDNRIRVGGTLRTPEGGIKVADVTVTHDLSTGNGAAALDVTGITFAPGGFQPERLTRLTFGVIASVNGTIAGKGDIRWNRDGVTSTGAFRTSGMDLAAAFGPVTGLSGEIRFADLLALETEPGQVVTIATVNPGIPVENGTLRYRLLPGFRIAIEQGRWPFAGGELLLEPTVLDFAKDQVRRMTFRVNGVDAGQFLQEFEFGNISATGTFDGVLPMIFDASGGRIENGVLAVREGGGKLAYVGEVSKEDVGLWGNIAFQALKSLNYRNLGLELNGPLAGEMVTQIRFAGVSQGEGTSSNFIVKRIAKLPFQFNITIRAPFRQLIDSVQSYYDPRRLIERNLPALLEERRRREQATPKPPGVQPPESGNQP
jgi:hypothetical protein